MNDSPEVHPIQIPWRIRKGSGKLSSLVTRSAYEVYEHVYAPQPAMIDLEGRNCRGGFGLGELIAFLYARSFPKNEWHDRVEEAFRGMELEDN